MMETVKVYGAYGSNMNLKQMAKRCPNARVIGTGKLQNYKLTFRGTSHGVANVEPKHGSSVPILLWEITPECEDALDIYEGYPRLYVKKEVDVVTDDGLRKTMIYVMAKRYEEFPAQPSRGYLDTIWKGYIENKMPLVFLRQAVSENIDELSDAENKHIKHL
jgi:gamma-glutamylcyclotransferase (GGCT)/AIG2-like uncharacterized protein YtfP